MLARLILILLLACLALPAMATAPCHDGSAGMAMNHDAPLPDRERKAVAAHSCMGCIPPATLQRAAIAAPPPTIAVRRTMALLRFDHGLTMPPATPPPRFEG